MADEENEEERRAKEKCEENGEERRKKRKERTTRTEKERDKRNETEEKRRRKKRKEQKEKREDSCFFSWLCIYIHLVLTHVCTFFIHPPTRNFFTGRSEQETIKVQTGKDKKATQS